MLFKNVSIHTVAHLEAPVRVTSAEISARLAKTLTRLKLPLNYLERMTGIKERRFWDKNQLPSEVATLVAEKVIAKSGLSKNDIGAVINTSITKEFIEPSIAAIIHGNLKMPAECMNFDLTNACLGFLNGIHIAASMIEGGQMDHVLVVAGENSYDIVETTLERLEKETTTQQNFIQQIATLTCGSGAVAMIISRTDLAPFGHPILGMETLSATEHSHLCCASSDRMVTNAPKIVEFGVHLLFKTHQKAQASLGWKTADFDEFALHQVSKPMINLLVKTLDIDDERVMRTYPDYGNMGPISLPFTIAKLETTKRLVPGKQLAMIGAGSGLNSMMMKIQW